MTTITHVNIVYKTNKNQTFFYILVKFHDKFTKLIWNHFFFTRKPDTHTCRLITWLVVQWCAHGFKGRGCGVRIQTFHLY